MPVKDPWFVGERAYAFSALLLTSHGELVVQQQRGTDDGIDLLVEVLKNGKRAMRVFGVQLKGCLSLPSLDETGDSFGSGNLGQAEYDLPVCAFLIDVKKNEGYFCWVVEPIVEDEEPSLERCREPRWKPLNAQALKIIVGRVAEWYDALRPVVKG